MPSSAAKASRLGPLTGASYCVGCLLIGISLLDYAATVWPFLPGDGSWRYGAIGILSGFTLTPLLGGLLISATAAFAGHRRTLRGAGLFHLAVAAGLVILIGAFGLDAVQARGDRAPEGRDVMEIGSAKAAIKLLLTALAATWIGIAALRQGRRGTPADPDRPDLIVGR